MEANGHTPSIMDYARFNYIAQPEDSISRAGIFPRIGIYDDWSIEWGYRWMPEFKTAEDEIPHMNKWIISKLKEDKRYTISVRKATATIPATRTKTWETMLCWLVHMVSRT